MHTDACKAFWEMATLNEYRSKFPLLSKQEVIAERRELLETINCNAFFPLKSWPQEYQRMFWAKPIGDKETFKLMMFCLGNGCAPQLITHWIILSQSWLPMKAEKRAQTQTCVHRLYPEQCWCQTKHLVLLWPGLRQMATPQRTAQT